MTCRNHPEVPAVDRCAGCAELFCANCLVEIQGEKFCGSCKVMAVKDRPLPEESTVPSSEAREGFWLAVAGFFCVIIAIVLEPIAIYKALAARKAIQANPRLSGLAMANATLVLAVIGLIVWAVSMVALVGREM